MIYIVLTNFFANGYFGAYTAMLNARKAVENFLKSDSIASWTDTGNYGYTFEDKNGTTYWLEITTDELDYDCD